MALRFLHLSDLHISADSANNTDVQQKIAYIKSHYPDHYYIITGDIIDNEGTLLPGTIVPVNKNDPQLWASVFAAPPPPLGSITPHLDIAREGMHKAYALLSQLPLHRVFICAGNHDFGLWGNAYDDAFVDAFNAILWQPINGGKPLLQLGEMNNPFALPHARARTPVMFTVADAGTTVQLILLNTNPDSSSSTLLALASGWVGGEQMNKLQKFVAAELMLPTDLSFLRKNLGIVRIVAFHHHPWLHSSAHKLNDAETLLGFLRRTTDLVLFGHRHVQKQYGANTWEAAQIQYGGLASGWIRSEATAAEVVINDVHSVQLSYVPIL